MYEVSLVGMVVCHMIVFVDGKKYTIKEPRPATLKKYGLSLNDWKEILAVQGYRCPICLNVLCKTTNIDHFHAQGWSKMSDEKRKLYVRGITDWYCNKNALYKGISIEKLQRTVQYLIDFEKRKPK